MSAFGNPPAGYNRPSKRDSPPVSGKGSGWRSDGDKADLWNDFDQRMDPQPSVPGPSTGRWRKPPQGKGKGRQRFNRTAFYQGQTAWQYLRQEDYIVLRQSHDWRLDAWTRDNNISWACTLLLRHVNSYENKQVKLKPDGCMLVSELVKFRMLRILGADAAELDRVMKVVNRGDKIRFIEKREANDELVELGVGQGHSGKAHAQIDDEVHLTKLTKDQVPRWTLHGTKKQFTASIAETGLMPGGTRGSGFRAHIHLVKFVNGSGETS